MKTSKFEIADYLDSKEMRTAYLNTVLEEGNATDVVIAMDDINRAEKTKNITQIAKKTDVTSA